MRKKRPELYSDTEFRSAYNISRPVLNHHLATLTERNEHKPFEEFCRALAQREICRNLRPQTGPEGGGDGKVDTETYPVSSEIKEVWYEGLANKNSERWAFAVSAKKDWATKVRADVASIVGTDRDYKHVHFFTNQNPKAARRLAIEDELSKKFGLRVTIYDRNWIEEKTLENNHHDLAFDILGVGEFNPTDERRGPRDTERQAELDAIEKELSQPDKSRLKNLDRVSEALRAAKLSRGLEKPRVQTEGRFQRCIKFAQEYGTPRQVLVALYEHAWTLIWWFDDLSGASELYDDVKQAAYYCGSSVDLEKLSNLYQVFASNSRNDKSASEALRISERGSELREKIEFVSKKSDAPNNAIHAEALLALHDLTNAVHQDRLEDAKPVWKCLSDIVGRAKGYVEFPARMLDNVITGISPYVPDSEELDELLLLLADFMGERELAGKKGEILLLQGKRKLKNELATEAIVYLAQAAVCFHKKEYQEQQFQALYMLAVAYRAIGLLWMARASVLNALVIVNAVGDEAGEMREEIIPITKLFTLICIQLGYLPDILHSMHLLRIVEAHMSLSEEGEKKLADDIIELDQLISCLLVAAPVDQLAELSETPSRLEHLDLVLSYTALLYRLGYLEELRSQGYFQDNETDQEIALLFNRLAGQSVAGNFGPKLILNAGSKDELRTTLLGVGVTISHDGSQFQTLIAEYIAASVEGFHATLINHEVFPALDSARILIDTSKQNGEIQTDVDEAHQTIKVLWSNDIGVSELQHAQAAQRSMVEVSALLAGLTTTTRDFEGLIEELVENEKVFDRAVLASNISPYHQRVFGKPLARLDDVTVSGAQSFQPKNQLPVIHPASDTQTETETDGSVSSTMKRHDEVKIETVINPHLWDKARWSGTGYAVFDLEYPPVFGLSFSDETQGFKIFELWRERFGDVDEDDVLRVSVISGINRDFPLHYRVHLSQSRSAMAQSENPNQKFFSLSRHNLMTPSTREHLEMFRKHYDKIGAFYLAPMEIKNGQPHPRLDLKLIKRKFSYVEAWQVDLSHEDAPAIGLDDKIIIPDGIQNAPVEELLQVIRSKKKLGPGPADQS